MAISSAAIDRARIAAAGKSALQAGALGCVLIVLSHHDDLAVAEAAMAEGAGAVVLKRQIADDLLPAVHTVLSGGTFLSS